MKSSALRAKLEALEREHGDLEVTTEGCDCDGDAGDVISSNNWNGKCFYITRGTPVDREAEAKRLEANAKASRERDRTLEAKYPGLLP